jgi:Rha family phage regulatory protein
MNQLQRSIPSLEVAEMVGRPHDNVLKDIRRIISQLGDVKSYESYFIESTYKNSQNKELPCFLLGKKGCELYGTRMTGATGTLFAVKYIERFNEMEQEVEKPKSQLEIMQMQIEQMVKQEQRINVIEEKTAQIEAKQDNITEIISLNPTEWRKKVTRILSKIAEARGGYEAHRLVRNESYELLEERAKCKLALRVSNKQKNLSIAGANKTAINKVSKLDVIADDTRLTEIYLAIVKESAIKHQISIEGLGA